jgi:conjugative relaxase-like TrwC/TraI family protein
MLSVAKIAPGQESYYLDTVAAGLEDYYSGRGESPGRWTGNAAKHLDLEGRVAADVLGAVLGGRDPETGTRLGQLRKDRVPGFDLTFSAPKSVSVLWGLGDPDTAGQVRAAHDAAVDAALGWLEREACRSRRGIDGHETIAADGFVAAGFVHRSSRAGDPQLHTHVLVANITRCEDGRWRALDGKALLWQARTAGYLYKAHLRHELTARLGVDWGPVHKGAAEIEGIPSQLCEMFATRRREIEDELAAHGLHSPKAAETAALYTREAKDHDVRPTMLRDSWIERAHANGYEPEVLHEALGRAEPMVLDGPVRRLGIETLLGPHGLTEHATVFDRRDVLRAWCEHLPHGAPVSTLEALATETSDGARVVALTDIAPYPKLSTHDLVALEQRLVDTALITAEHGRAVVAEAMLRSALDARPELSPEQVAAVARLTTSGNGIEVFVAAAGTGKTFCLDAARDAWTRSGYHVIGTALAATAAAQLQAEAAIPSDTIALRALQLADGSLSLDRRTVLVVDEAAMVGTRQLAVLLDHARAADAKVVLVGDPKQLNAIHAGGLLNGLAQRMSTVTLEENRRQHEAWERDALAQLRAGDIDTALACYQDHGRIVTAPTAIDLRNRMTADWYAATLAGDRVVMLAERRYDVDDLNRRARNHYAAAGHVSGPVLDIEGRVFQAGDRVLCLRNDRKVGVHNGTLATITTVDAERRVATIRTDAGTRHDLPPRYLDAGHLAHGYALTIHKSQGLTVDRCLVLGSDTLDHNAGYTALSRGRADNRIYLHDAAPDPEAHARSLEQKQPREVLAGALARDRTDRLAIDHQRPATRREPLREELRRLHTERAPLLRVRDRMPPSRRADITALTRERAQLADQAARQRAELDSIRVGIRHRRERLEHRFAAERRVDHTTTRLNDVDAALAEAKAAQRDHTQYRKQHRPELDRLTELDTRITQRVAEVINEYTSEPPDHLKALGPYPTEPWRQDLWRSTATDIEHYRAEHDITDRDQPLGTVPRYGNAAYEAHRRVIDDIKWAQRSLHPTPERAMELEVDHGMGLEL